MLYFPQTRGYISQEFPTLPGVQIAAEGQALVAVTDGGSFGLKPSTGAASEVFAGVAVSQQITITSKAHVESLIAPAGLTMTLARTPSAGTLSVYDVTAGGVIAGGDLTLVDDSLTVLAGIAGHELNVFYKYAVTAAESRTLQGDIYPGGAAGFEIDQVGVYKNGTVFTDQFDTTVNWNASNPVVRLGANGQFTIGGTGTIVPCMIVQAPNSSSPFLGLNLTN